MKSIVHATLLALLLPAATFAAVYSDTTDHKETGFSDGTLNPFSVCTTQSPNYVKVVTFDSGTRAQFYWTQSGYDGTRMDRGAELCGGPSIYKDGWMGFSLYLPSPGFPTDKEQGIAQIFASGGTCPSWAGMLVVRNNQLLIRYRHACVDPSEGVVVNDIQRNTWIPIIIHFTVSHMNAGVVEVWYGDTACSGYNAPTPTYRAANINFGWGQWLGTTDSLDPAYPDKAIGFKNGMYNYDTANYTVGESRTLYLDNLSQQNGTNGNYSGTWRWVNPTR